MSCEMHGFVADTAVHRKNRLSEVTASYLFLPVFFGLILIAPVLLFFNSLFKTLSFPCMQEFTVLVPAEDIFKDNIYTYIIRNKHICTEMNYAFIHSLVKNNSVHRPAVDFKIIAFQFSTYIFFCIRLLYILYICNIYLQHRKLYAVLYILLSLFSYYCTKHIVILNSLMPCFFKTCCIQLLCL